MCKLLQICGRLVHFEQVAAYFERVFERVEMAPHMWITWQAARTFSRVSYDRDMEGVVAKQASARYTPEATTWVKIKNRHYSQAVGRQDFFDRHETRPA